MLREGEWQANHSDCVIQRVLATTAGIRADEHEIATTVDSCLRAIDRAVVEHGMMRARVAAHAHLTVKYLQKHGRAHWKDKPESEAAIRGHIAQNGDLLKAVASLRSKLLKAAKLLTSYAAPIARTTAETLAVLEWVQSDRPIPGKGRWEDFRKALKRKPAVAAKGARS